MTPIFKRYYPTVFLIIGIGIVVGHLFFIKNLDHIGMLLLLIVFVWLCEHYYIPTDDEGSSLILPILFAIRLYWNLSVAIEVVAMVTLIDGLLFKQRKLRTFLYPFKLVISFTITVLLLTKIRSLIPIDWVSMVGALIWSTFLAIFYSSIKVGLKASLEKVNKDEKRKRVKSEWRWRALILACSIVYCWLYLIMSQQNRGIIDVLAFFFFFSPTVAASLLVAFISRLQKEKRRLSHVFALTTLVNNELTLEDPIYKLVIELRKLISVDASVLLLTENDQWDVFHKYGDVQEELNVEELLDQDILQTDKLVEARQDGSNSGFFKEEIQTLIYTPLKVEGDLIGLWVIGSQYKNAYSNRDFQSFITLSKQVAAIAKTRRLIRKQHKHQLFEERNRIAREIHDGIAQTIAGAVMNLQIAEKALHSNPVEAQNLIRKSTIKLRSSLGQVRSSIYALRPDPFEKIGLKQAIQDRAQIFEEENPQLKVRMIFKGEERVLGVFTEKGIFDIFKEELRNIEKHAEATKVTILVGYFEHTFCLLLKDNGKGFSLGESLIKAKNNHSFGIINMSELADQLGGNLDIESRKGRGAKITLKVPYTT